MDANLKQTDSITNEENSQEEVEQVSGKLDSGLNDAEITGDLNEIAEKKDSNDESKDDSNDEQIIEDSNEVDEEDSNDQQKIENDSNEEDSNRDSIGEDMNRQDDIEDDLSESESDDFEKINAEKEQATEDQSDDEAPEQVNFSSTKKTAQKLAEQQMNMLNRIKKQEQEKRKLNQERNIEQKKLKTTNKNEEKSSDDESPVEYRDIERETKTSKLKIILNDEDQVDKMNNKLIKKYSETNNRVISFKDRSIFTNPNIKRVDNTQARRMLHKRKVK